MKIWKPLTKFKKPRGEHAWHADFALEEGEELSLAIADEIHHLESCPDGLEYKIHLMICVEPFKKEGNNGK